MSTLTYSTPTSADTHLEGTWQLGDRSGDFSIPIINTDGVQDIAATVEKMKAIQQQALDIEAAIGE